MQPCARHGPRGLRRGQKTQQAVILNLILIGEEATKVLKDHEAFALANAHVPWRAMKGMRNRIAHGYFEINLDVVWETVQSALPQLTEQLNALRAYMDAPVCQAFNS